MTTGHHDGIIIISVTTIVSILDTLGQEDTVCYYRSLVLPSLGTVLLWQPWLKYSGIHLN